MANWSCHRQKKQSSVGHLLQDYDLATPGDWGRTIALFLTLGLVQGGFLGKGRAPVFLIRKNKHQGGGSLLLRLVCAIYGLEPRPVSQSEKPARVIEDRLNHPP